MENEIFISLGIPKHGWLPVTFRHKDFGLDFDASDVLNDPIEELYNLIISHQTNEKRTITWWLEPAAYLFNFEATNQVITLAIIEKEDLNRDSSKEIVLTTISGDRNKMLSSFLIALKEFTKEKYEEQHWPYYLGKDKIAKL